MRLVLSLLLALHGAIHLLGAAKGLRLAEVAQMHQAISARSGLAWLAAGLLLISAAVLVVIAPRFWWMTALAGIALSQLLIVGAWSDAKFGTVANVVLLIPLVIVIADKRPSSFRNRFARDARTLLAAEATAATVSAPHDPQVVTSSDLTAFPPLLQRYLTRAGVVGKPRVHNVRLRFTAQMRNDAKSPWMDATATQYEFYGPTARLFLMDAARSGIPFVAFHRYVGSEATFQVRIAGLYPMVDEAGPLLTRGETVTIFNDMCLLAPGSLIGAPVTWTVVDDTTLHALYTNAAYSIEAVLAFDANGDISNFTSLDRPQEIDGKLVPNVWDTPVGAYAMFDGMRIVSKAEARYAGSAYGTFTITGAEFNVRGRQ
jgi:hypothetical protein